MGVFDIEDLGSTKRARVAYPRNCSMCRECIRGDGWGERVSLRRVRDHFIFSVETVGAYTPVEVVREALKILKSKAETLKEQLLGQNKDDEEEEEEEEEEEAGETGAGDE